MYSVDSVSGKIRIRAALLLMITCALIIIAGLFSCAYAKDAENGGSYDIGSDSIDIKDNNISCTISGSTDKYGVARSWLNHSYIIEFEKRKTVGIP